MPTGINGLNWGGNTLCSLHFISDIWCNFAWDESFEIWYDFVHTYINISEAVVSLAVLTSPNRSTYNLFAENKLFKLWNDITDLVHEMRSIFPPWRERRSCSENSIQFVLIKFNNKFVSIFSHIFFFIRIAFNSLHI